MSPGPLLSTPRHREPVAGIVSADEFFVSGAETACQAWMVSRETTWPFNIAIITRSNRYIGTMCVMLG